VWQLFGHVHSKKEGMVGLDKPRMDYLFDNQYDVGVDNNNYEPVSYYEVKKIITLQELLNKQK
jgi:calcineurin-like phosphoesterase family protein